MNRHCLFSIIIPVFNGKKYIYKSLDSIYSQNLDKELFEVICIDDHSTEIGCYEHMLSYAYNGKHPGNLRIFQNETNKKAGGARNVGINLSIGKWVVFLDCDDIFLEGSLVQLSSLFEVNSNLDILIYNYKSTLSESGISNLSKCLMTGLDFIRTQPVPWFACCYSYQRDFLLKNQIFFVENVFYEDTDFAFRAILKAQTIQFFDLKVFFYLVSDFQASKVNTKEKILDMFYLTQRLLDISNELEHTNLIIRNAILNHYNYKYNVNLKRYLWHFPYDTIKAVLKKFPPSINDKSTTLVRITSQSPCFYAVLAVILRPFFNLYLKYK